MRFGFYAGETDKTIYIRLRDSTTGLAKTGLVFNSAGASASYVLPGAAAVAITLATQTVTGAHADGGFVEVSATIAKGLYRLDLPDAAIASGAFCVVNIEFDGVIEESILLELDTQKVNAIQLAGQTVTAAAGVTFPSSVASAAALDIVDDFLDTEIAAILAAVDTEIAALPTAAQIVDEWESQSQSDPTGFHVNVKEWNGTGGLNATMNLTSGVNTPVVALGVVSPLTADDATAGAIQTCFDGTLKSFDALDTAQDTQHATTQTKIDTVDDFLDTEIAAILAAVDTEVAAILVDTGTDIPATLSTLFTTALTESYRGTGATGTVAQLLYELLANRVEFANVGTTRTAKKLDGSTPAKTYTYDSTTPTSITETT